MKLNLSFAVVGLISSVAFASYQRAPIPYLYELDCTSCIRGGWNYCLDIGGTGSTIVS